MNKVLSLVLAGGLAASMLTTSCTKEKMTPTQQSLDANCGRSYSYTTYGADDDRTFYDVPTINACGTKTINLGSGSKNSGTVTISNTTDSLYVTIQGTNSWKMTDANVYVGTKSGMPMSNSITPNINRFKIQDNFTSTKTVVTYAFALSSLPTDFVVVTNSYMRKATGYSGCGTTYSYRNSWGLDQSFGSITSTNCYGQTTTTYATANYIDFTPGSCAGSGSGGNGGGGNGNGGGGSGQGGGDN